MSDPLSNILPDFMHFAMLNATQLVFLLGIVMFFGAVGGLVFQKLKIPQVVGYIVIGIAIGSSGLQVLRPQTISALNPINTVALSLIGFLVGGELKINTIKKYGKQFIGILLFESIVPFFVVGFLVCSLCYFVTKNIKLSFSLALVLGSISSATAPAATTDVLKEFRTKGPLTTTVLGIVAMDDAVALILYAIASSLASPLLGGKSIAFLPQLLSIFKDIVGSILVGGVAGFFLSFIIKSIMADEGRILSFTLGALFLSTGVCVFLALDNILCAMAFGFFMVNFAPAKTRATFKLTEKFTPPIYVLFFVLVGAKLNIWVVTPFLALVAVLYVFGRTLGKSIGARLGAILTKAPASVRDYLPFCLLSQAGVAIGLSIAAGQDFADSIGPQVLLIITATTFIVQLAGPICVKYGVQKAGECGLDVTIDDIKAKTTVGDIAARDKHSKLFFSQSVVKDTQTVGHILDLFSKYPNLCYVVQNDKKQLLGLIRVQELKEVLHIGDFANNMLSIDIMEKFPPACTCKMQTALPEVYRLFDEFDTEAVPVINENKEPLGVIEKFVSDHYLHSKILEVQKKTQNF